MKLNIWVIYILQYTNVFSAIDHMNCHPSKHVSPNPLSSKSTNHQRSRRRACSSCKVRQYFDFSTDEMIYLSKLKVALQKVNQKLCHKTMTTHHKITSNG